MGLPGEVGSRGRVPALFIGFLITRHSEWKRPSYGSPFIAHASIIPFRLSRAQLVS